MFLDYDVSRDSDEYTVQEKLDMISKAGDFSLVTLQEAIEQNPHNYDGDITERCYGVLNERGLI